MQPHRLANSECPPYTDFPTPLESPAPMSGPSPAGPPRNPVIFYAILVAVSKLLRLDDRRLHVEPGEAAGPAHDEDEREQEY